MTTSVAFRSNVASSRNAEFLVAGGFFGAVLALLLAGQGHLLRFSYPLGAVALGAWYCARSGFLVYMLFTWSIWFLTPGLRRIVDYQSGGWDAANPMSLTPLLVASLAAAIVVRRLPELRRLQLSLWGLAGASLIPAYFIGILNAGLLPATHSLLTWIVPLLFGLSIAVEWRQYPQLARGVALLFTWSALLITGYGLLQFLNPPPWDVAWIEGSGMRSVGPAVAMKIRVFSILNSPLACGTMLMAAFFLAMSRNRVLRIIVPALAIAGVMFTLVRSVWLATLIGMVVFLFALPMRVFRRTMLTASLIAVTCVALPLALPEATRSTVIETISLRVNTLGDLHGDLSFDERMVFMSTMTEQVLERPLGHGLGSTGVSSALAIPSDGVRDFDNGLLAVLYSLGWIGGFVFFGSVLTMALMGLVRREMRGDLVAASARAILIASLTLSLGGNVFEGFSAMMLWGFAGLLLASQQYGTFFRRQHAQRVP